VRSTSPHLSATSLALAHACLEREFDQHSVGIIRQLGEQPREFFVLEVGRFLALWPGLGFGPKLANGIPNRLAVDHRRLEAGAERAQVLGPG